MISHADDQHDTAAEHMVGLLYDPDLQPFWERLGPQRATGMMSRKNARQSGG